MTTDFTPTLTRAQADEQYNPILWTQRLPQNQLLPAHERYTTRRSDDYRERVGAGLTSLAFGEGELAGEIDVFRPEGVSDDASIVVYIHGGWWQWFSKEQFSFVAEPFNRRGYAVYMPGYRLAQDWDNGRPMESIRDQMELATAEVLREAVARGAPAVYLVGHSAGGHLVALLRCTDWSRFGLSRDDTSRLKGAFSLAGLFDIRPLVGSYVNDAIAMTVESAARVSPHLLVASACRVDYPLHLVLPEFDTAEFFRQTKEYQRVLMRAGRPCHLKVVENRDHLDMIERLPDPDDALMTYLLRHMAHGVTSDAVKRASRAWIENFNAGEVEKCARAYTGDARMIADPIGEFCGREAIEAFWREFVATTGATDLEYRNVSIEVLDEQRVVLGADWRMNVGRGVITKEMWVRQADGVWRLKEDAFHVRERFEPSS